ncbi:hypothetical protein FGF1_37550 [Flavobacteriaceae bacterium GF1]
MKIFYTVLILSISVFICSAQERFIKGTITDGENLLPNANVQIVNSGVSTNTDEDGKYRILASPGDALFYNYPGMEPIQIRVEDVTKTLNVEMFPKVVKLKNVTVTQNRNNSQKELETQYATNPNILKTLFGYLDKTKVSYSVRIMDGNDILPGEYNLALVLQNRFAGIRVLNGLGMGSGTVGTPNATTVGFGAAFGANAGRSVLLRGGRAIFDIDGQLFTDFPDFIDVQNIRRIGILSSSAGTVKYGTMARGGVIVINTKTGTVIPKDKNGRPWDTARLRNNFLREPVVSSSVALKNAPTYLRELESATTFEEAQAIFESNLDKYAGNPYFILDAYRFFYEKWNAQQFADAVVEGAMDSFVGNPVVLKALAYIYESQERFGLSHQVTKDVFILRPHYAQSYLELANSNRNLGKTAMAAKVYARYFYLLDEGFMETDTSTFSTIIKREFNNLLALEVDDRVVKSKRVSMDGEEYKGTRLVFEWNDSEAEFDLQFVNPEGQYYTWKHSLEENPEIILREKELGYACSEYLIDGSIPGIWRANIKYQGNKSLTPTYLKATIYHNYGSKEQRKEVRVFKLNVKDTNQELFNVRTIGSIGTP